MSLGFSRAQQGLYRGALNAAWKHSGAGQAVDDFKRAGLLAATGYTSSAQCNGEEDFEAVMRHFTKLAGPSWAGEALKWELKAQSGNYRRLKFATGYEAPESYFETIAERVCSKPLAALTSADRAEVISKIKMQQDRQEKRGDSRDGPQPKSDDPF